METSALMPIKTAARAMVPFFAIEYVLGVRPLSLHFTLLFVPLNDPSADRQEPEDDPTHVAERRAWRVIFNGDSADAVGRV